MGVLQALRDWVNTRLPWDRSLAAEADSVSAFVAGYMAGFKAGVEVEG